jgi:PAS domain-containing protein
MATDHQKPEDLFYSIFNVIPSPTFVVDGDIQIHEYNTAAATFLASDRAIILRRRCGEVFHCLHLFKESGGCGRTSFCKDCVIRNSVSTAVQGNKVVRRQYKLELIRDGKILEFYTLITTSPFMFQRKQLVLLVIEDISDILEELKHLPLSVR